MKDGLRTALIVIAVVAVAIGYVHLQENKGYALKKGSLAPTFRLPALSGAEVDLAALRGRLVVVNFWATWCPPCVAEMPSLERLHRALGPAGLVVLGVSVDEDEAELRRFVSGHGISFPVLRDPGSRLAGSAYRTTGYPETFVVGSTGLLEEQYVGPAQWDTPETIAHFRALLPGSPAARAQPPR